MRRALEIAVFAGLAVILHIAAFAVTPSGGAESQGAGGETRISLAGASAQTIAMVQEWEQPPEIEVVDMPEPTTPPLTSDLRPTMTMPQAPEIAQVLPQMIPLPPDIEPVVADTQSVPPPQRYAPTISARPQARPPPRPQQAPSTLRAEQRAAGADGGTQAGKAATAAVSTLSSGQQAELKAVWDAQILSRVERRKRFPRNARGQGEVVVTLTVSSQGALVSSSIRQSSGVDAFDQSALQAVARASPFPAAPEELSQTSYQFSLLISFLR